MPIKCPSLMSGFSGFLRLCVQQCNLPICWRLSRCWIVGRISTATLVSHNSLLHCLWPNTVAKQYKRSYLCRTWTQVHKYTQNIQNPCVHVFRYSGSEVSWVQLFWRNSSCFVLHQRLLRQWLKTCPFDPILATFLRPPHQLGQSQTTKPKQVCGALVVL